jgi:hypothetical protein
MPSTSCPPDFKSPKVQVLAGEGVTRYNPLGDKFDPNLHNALFEVPDATKEPGTIAVVVKVRAAQPLLCTGCRQLAACATVLSSLLWEVKTACAMSASVV